MSRMVEIQIDDRDVQKKLRAFAEAGPAALEQGLYALGSDIFADSQGIVPRDTGALAASGGIEGPYTNAYGSPEVLIYYGGPAAEYALFVHEDLDAYHDPPTSAKYLEGPFIAHIQDVDVAVGVEIAKELKRRGAY